MDRAGDPFETEGYFLERLLHEDCWGGLYLARYAPLGNRVLFRWFNREVAADGGAWGLTVAEIQAWARVGHHGVLQVLDWGRAGGEGYLATEEPGGAALLDVLAGGSCDDPQGVFEGVLDALAAAFRRGLLHLGLTPTNIWVSEGPQVKVGEFGLWYVSRDHPHVAGFESPFLAPEQASGERVSAATDVYALGLVHIALHHGLEAAAEAARAGRLPDDLSSHRPALARCLDRHPPARYRSVREMSDSFGWKPGGAAPDDFRDCPLCALKREIADETAPESARGERHRGPRERIDYRACAWWLVAALAVLAIVVWWMALR